jgi:hypothetical protein
MELGSKTEIIPYILHLHSFQAVQAFANEIWELSTVMNGWVMTRFFARCIIYAIAVAGEESRGQMPQRMCRGTAVNLCAQCRRQELAKASVPRGPSYLWRIKDPGSCKKLNGTPSTPPYEEVLAVTRLFTHPTSIVRELQSLQNPMHHSCWLGRSLMKYKARCVP